MDDAEADALAARIRAGGPHAACAEALDVGTTGGAAGIAALAAGMLRADPGGPHAGRFALVASVCLARAGRGREAVEMAEAAAAAGGGPDAWCAKGSALEDAGDAEGALGCYREAERLSGGAAWHATLLKASALDSLGRTEEAAGEAARAGAAGAGPAAAALRASCLVRLGRHAEALGAIEGCGEAGGRALAASRAAALEGEGRHLEALAAANGSIREYHPDPEMWYIKARLLARTGRAEPALDALTVAVSLDPRCAEEARRDPAFGPVSGSERFARAAGGAA